jgi:hypothetical protein
MDIANENTGYNLSYAGEKTKSDEAGGRVHRASQLYTFPLRTCYRSLGLKVDTILHSHVFEQSTPLTR